MSYNPCGSLAGVEKLRKLRVLYMGNCKVPFYLSSEYLRTAPYFPTDQRGVRWFHPTPSPMAQISDKKEIMRLQELPGLEEVVFFGNPLHKDISAKEGELAWASFMMEILPELRKLDGISCVEWRQKLNEGNEAQLKEIFEKMDVDSSGDVTITEMKGALGDEEICAFCKLTPAKVDDIFAEVEAEGISSLEWDLFKKFFSR